MSVNTEPERMFTIVVGNVIDGPAEDAPCSAETLADLLALLTEPGMTLTITRTE